MNESHAHHLVLESHDEAVARWDSLNLPASKRKFIGVCKYCGESKEYPISHNYTLGGQGGGSKNQFSINGHENWSRKNDETFRDPTEYQTDETLEDETLEAKSS